VLTEIGPVTIQVPRDTDATFDPQIVKKRQRRLTGIDEIVLSLSAKGLTTGEIAAHFDDVYGATVSRDTISRITDKVLGEMAEWQNRPLELARLPGDLHRRHPREDSRRPGGQQAGLRGHRGHRGRGARHPRPVGRRRWRGKFWLAVLTEIRNRGVEDVCIAVCDGLKGLPDAVTTVWPLTVVQTCLIHLIRNTFRYASRKYWDEMSRDLRPVYTAAAEAAAKERFAEFAAKWGPRYPAIVRMWEKAWSEFAPFLDYDVEIRRVICSTNAIESLNARYRRAIRARGALPDRAGRTQVPVPGDPSPGPDRQGPGTMGHEMERSTKRILDHIRRTNHTQHQLTSARAESTVNQILPTPDVGFGRMWRIPSECGGGVAVRLLYLAGRMSLCWVRESKWFLPPTISRRCSSPRLVSSNGCRGGGCPMWSTSLGDRFGRSRRIAVSAISPVGIGLRRWAAWSGSSPGSSGITWWRSTSTPRWSGSCPSRFGCSGRLWAGKRRRHAPDFLVRSARGAVMVLDSPPAHLIGERDREAFAATGRACAALSWRYAVRDRLDGVFVANQRWLAGYRHPRCLDEHIAAQQ